MKTRRRNLSGDRLTTTTRRNTRSKTSENGRGNSLTFPIDLIMEIFSRLPVKSIAICRCVSKTWASVLRRQDFTELFLSRSRTLPKLLLAYQKDGDLFFYSAPQPQNPDENSSSVVATYHMKFSFDADFLGDAFEISGLDQGLVGLTSKWIVKGRKYSAPVICNPSTGQLLPLPRVKTRRVKSMSLFGYDPIDKQVKVLSMSGSYGSSIPVAEEYQIMTLGTGKLSQRMIDSGRILRYYPHFEGICINGFLLSGESDYVDESSTSVNLWVLEDTHKQEWSERTFVLPALWEEDIVESAMLGFVGMTGTNEIVMRPLSLPGRPFYLIYFNIERNTVVRVAIQGMNGSEYDHVHIFLDHVENVKLL